HVFSCGMCCIPLMGAPTVHSPLALLFEAGPVLTVVFSGMLHGWIAAVCCHWAIQRMRPWYRMRASAPALPTSQAYPGFPAETARPEISNDPLWWKERHGSLGFNWAPETRAFHSAVAYPGVVTGLVIFILVFGLQNLVNGQGNADDARMAREVV